MHFSTAVTFALAAVGFVAAQQKCDAQNIVDSCVSGYKSRIDGCNQKPNDFICLCDVYQDVLVCYNNCPNSQDKFPVQNQVTSYCNAAAPLRAAASSSAASVASVAATQSKAATSATSAAASGSGTKSSASATASSFSTGAAAALGAPAGAALVALFAGLL